MSCLPKRKKSSHKGENGRVLIIGGSENYPGAINLATLAVATLRTGPDLVTVFAPEKVAWTINSISPDVITVKGRGKILEKKHLSKILYLSRKADVILLGPGIGHETATKKLIFMLLKDSHVKIMKKVIDADVLRMISFKMVENSILTPHKAEFLDLLANSYIADKPKDPLHTQHDIRNNVILLKGQIDQIIASDKICRVQGGSPGMTVGGTGDVLSGVCAGLVSQGIELKNAAILASKIMKHIGKKLEKKMGYGFIASDFIDHIPEAMLKLKN